MRDVARVSADGESFDLASVSFPCTEALVSLRDVALIECCSFKEMERFVSARDSLPYHRRGFIVPYTVEEYQRKEREALGIKESDSESEEETK